ncbi:hypothetical protein [Bosea sp. RAC05]|uniref:hypothetical protein n=1 Tax=Bosea sp. RAC05 TaxID=1842539 RepID=UPI000857137D|nr:hypothetical protein [Bosea sp. RAC05]AOG02825.1 hypothetical protein BSY19_5164 [Bosea sp. RAC05]
MPLYLVRETDIPAPMSVVAADRVAEFEVEAPDARAAAALVLFRKPGAVVDGVTPRKAMDPYLESYIQPDPSRYAGILNIGLGKPETMPVWEPTDRPKSIGAIALEVMRLHALILGQPFAGDFSADMRSLLGSMIDYAKSEGVDFNDILSSIAEDYEVITHRQPPQFRKLDLDDLQPSAVDPRVGRSAVILHTQLVDIEDNDDPEIGLYHLTYTLIEAAYRNVIDFPDLLDQVVADRTPAATSPRI